LHIEQAGRLRQLYYRRHELSFGMAQRKLRSGRKMPDLVVLFDRSLPIPLGRSFGIRKPIRSYTIPSDTDWALLVDRQEATLFHDVRLES
jgi:hypothetical protein